MSDKTNKTSDHEMKCETNRFLDHITVVKVST